jgi:hypothetical protein
LLRLTMLLFFKLLPFLVNMWSLHNLHLVSCFTQSQASKYSCSREGAFFTSMETMARYGECKHKRVTMRQIKWTISHNVKTQFYNMKAKGQEPNIVQLVIIPEAILEFVIDCRELWSIETSLHYLFQVCHFTWNWTVSLGHTQNTRYVESELRPSLHMHYPHIICPWTCWLPLFIDHKL